MPDTATARPTTRFPTRILLSAAAIGAAGGLYVIALNYASVFTGAVAFMFYAATIALWMLPVLVAQALLQRPGIALLTAVLMGIVNAPFVVGGVAQILNFVVAGIIIELPFLVTLYRRWSTRFFWIAHPASGILFSALYAYLVAIGIDPAPWWVWVLVGVGAILSSFAVTALGQLIAGRLRKAGLGGRAG